MSKINLFGVASTIAIFLSLSVQAKDNFVQQYPNVILAKVRHGSGELFDFDVTISSPYDTPQRYADAFRVTGKSGQIFGERKLIHDHQDEQPFIRDLYGVAIPKGIRSVVIQARDQKYGYGGQTVDIVLPGR